MTSSPESIIYLDPETNEFKLNEVQYNKIFKNNETKFLPTAIISITGDCRKGKSFLLNFFLRYLKSLDVEEDPSGWVDIERESFSDWIGDVNEPLEGFSWRSGVDCDTKGITIWPEPLIVTRSDGTKIAVLLMDTQGLFDDETEHQTVARFFAISSLISSTQIYNQKHQIQSNDLTTLTTFSSFGKRVSGKTGHKAFQTLLILLRDWANPMQFSYGSQGGEQYLEHKRQTLSNNFGSQWKELESCYEEIACFLLPSIGDDACTDDNFDGRVRAIRAAFIIHLHSLVQTILSPDELLIKTLGGNEQQLWQIGTYIVQLTDKLKDSDSVEIDSLLAASDETKARNAVCEVILLYLNLLKESTGKGMALNKENLDKFERIAITEYRKKTQFVDHEIKDERFKELREFLKKTRELAKASEGSEWIHKLTKAVKDNIGTVGAIGAIVVAGISLFRYCTIS